MFGRIACPLAVLVVASVFWPGPVNSQCTTKHCSIGEDETDLWTTVLRLQDSIDRLQQHVEKQDEIIQSMKEEIKGPECESTKATLSANITLPNFCTKSYQYALKGDFNGDGHVDILCHDSQSGRKWIYYGSSNGYAGIGWGKNMGWCNHRGSSVYVGDFNGDNRTDMLCHDDIGRVWIAYADTAGHFTGTGWHKTTNFCKCTGCALCIVDVNKDSKSDMLCRDRIVHPQWWLAFATANGNFENL